MRDEIRALVRQVDRTDVPDQWGDIRSRMPRQLPSGPGAARRMVVVVVALGLSAVAFILVWKALGPVGPSPTSLASIEPSPSPTVASEFFPLLFAGVGDGWHVRNSGMVKDGTATTAWASNVPFDDRDTEPTAPAIPPYTIAALPPEAIVLTAEATPWGYDPAQGPYPPGSLDRLDLSSATIRGPQAEEPEGNYTVYEIPDGYVLVRVYFGNDAPTADQVQAAQDELDTLEVPPVCPVPSEGGYGATATPEVGAPGDTVTLTGPMPFQREDGSYDRPAGTVIIAWWNADPEGWAALSSFFDGPSPSPAGAGPLLRLGEGGIGMCSFSIAFTVPDVPPGDYPIVMLQEGPLPDPNGSALEASLVVRVTAPD